MLLRLAALCFFLTPICYPVESPPAAAMPVLSKNPLFVSVKAAKRWDRQPISKSRKLVSVPVLPN